MRYKVTGAWRIEKVSSVDGVRVSLEIAHITDTKNGQVYRDGAYRVQVGGKSIKGKGGTTPYFGESAWSDGERKFGDVVSELRFGANRRSVS